MYIEIIAAAIIFTLAGVIFYRNIKRKAEGKCDCSSCDRRCPNYKEKKTEK